jgi:hypothetical protein
MKFTNIRIYGLSIEKIDKFLKENRIIATKTEDYDSLPHMATVYRFSVKREMITLCVTDDEVFLSCNNTEVFLDILNKLFKSCKN